ncbi:MAG: MFS transporter, partial [Pseudomonadota bacterium]
MGFIFGPAIGGFIGGGEADADSFLYIGYVSAFFTMIAAFCTFAFVQESLTPERRRAAAAQKGTPSAFTAVTLLKAKPIVLWLTVLSLLVIGAGSLFEATFAFFTSDRFDWGPREIGLSFGLLGAIAAVTQAVLVGPLVRFFGEAQVMCGSLLIYAAGTAGIGFATNELLLPIALMFNALGIGLFSPAYQSYTAAQSNDADRGLVMGLTQAAGSLGRVVGPVAGGMLYAGIGPASPFYSGGVIMVVSLLLGSYTVWRYGAKART